VILISIYVSKKKSKIGYLILLLILSLNFISNTLLIENGSMIVYSPYCYESIGRGLITEFLSEKKYYYFLEEKQNPKNFTFSGFNSAIRSCYKLNQDHIFDCLNGFRSFTLIDFASIDICQNISFELQPFCYTSLYNHIGDFSKYRMMGWFSENITKIELLEYEITLKSKLRNFIDENLSDYEKIKLETDPGSREYGTFYTERKLHDCVQKDSKICITEISYDLAYSLGKEYIKTENILCSKLDDKYKKYCYAMIGQRIGQVNFLDYNDGLGDCRKLDSDYFSVCEERVCFIQNVYRPYANNKCNKDYNNSIDNV
jgi:hypothetical protein